MRIIDRFIELHVRNRPSDVFDAGIFTRVNMRSVAMDKPIARLTCNPSHIVSLVGPNVDFILYQSRAFETPAVGGKAGKSG